MNDFFGFDFVGILILLCILIYLLFDFPFWKEYYGAGARKRRKICGEGDGLGTLNWEE
jgi:hypothetical protein